MRVIAGIARSMPLKTIDSMATRPTQDRIKETLFNMLQPYVYGARFLDLFAGSGGIGIEALSRGACFAVFVDSSRDCAKVIQENLNFTKLNAKAEVMLRDSMSAISTLALREKEPFDLIFMDPPYNKGLEKEALIALRNTSLVSEDTILIFEADIKTDISFINEIGYELLKQKTYKTNQHVWLKVKSEAL